MKRKGKFYSKNEKATMQKLGLKPTLASGAGWIDKEDGQNDYVLCQHKSTDADSYRLKREDMRMLEYHALIEKKMPLFVVEFLSDGELYLIIKPEDLVDIVEYIKLPKSSLKLNPKLHDVENDNEIVNKPKKIIKSSNRDKFWKEKQKEMDKLYGTKKSKK